jgi:hypothetical protein
MNVTWRVTSKLTAQVIVELVSLAVIAAVTLTVGVAAAKLRFRHAIPPRPYPIGSSVGQNTPPADPSLPTTERGISERVDKKHTQKRQGWGLI